MRADTNFKGSDSRYPSGLIVILWYNIRIQVIKRRKVRWYVYFRYFLHITTSFDCNFVELYCLSVSNLCIKCTLERFADRAFTAPQSLVYKIIE